MSRPSNQFSLILVFVVGVHLFSDERSATADELAVTGTPPIATSRSSDDAGTATQKNRQAQSPESGRFLLPEGFVLESVATAPLVRYPLFGCLDDLGRLYVAEGTGHSLPGPELVKLKAGRITRLEDVDGDGRFDTSTLFADGLISPQGVLWHEGVVYVASHPAIWRLEDTDGDGRADRCEEFVGKFNFNGNGCDIHGPFLGMDGRLYWTGGRHGYRITRPDGTRLEGLASRIWRCRTDGTDLERVAGGGFDNPVEVAWTNDGEMVGTMDQGAGDCLLHYVEGGVYPEEHASTSEFPRTGPLLGVAKRYSVELPAALCGTMRYRSQQFGPEFRETLITTHYMTHKLVRSSLVREGATFRAEDTDFLVSPDPHLRLTDVLEDADGSLLMIDMGAWFTYGFLGNVQPRPEMLGAIYRIRRTGAPPVSDPRGRLLRLEERSAPELAALLDDARPTVRDRAINRLAKLGAPAVPHLTEVLQSRNASTDARCHALWAMCRIDAPEARTAMRLALAESAINRETESASNSGLLAVSMIATRAIGLHRDAAASRALAELLKQSSPPLRRVAAEALGRIGLADAIPAILEALGKRGDRFLEHSLIFALIQINDRERTLIGLEHADPQVRRAALIALDQMAGGALTRDQVVPLLDSDDAQLQQSALQILSRQPEWSDAAYGLVQKWLSAGNLSDEQQQSLISLVANSRADARFQRIIGTALANATTPSRTRMLLIAAIAQSRLEPLPEKWTEGLNVALADRESAVRWEALHAVRIRGWRQFDKAIKLLGHDATLPPELRIAALECAVAGHQTLDSPSFEFLTGQLTGSSNPLLRIGAARTIAASSLSREQLNALSGGFSQLNTMILRQILGAYTRNKDQYVGLALVDGLQASAAADSLTTSELNRLLSQYADSVSERAAPLRERLAARERDQADYLARLTAELERIRGNADDGKEVFLAARNNCFACHRAVGRGGTVGPDLSKIGQFRTRSELLESIVFPSRSITPQFQTHSIAMRDGRVATGLVVRETADALYVRAPDLAEIRVARSNVEDVVPATVSLMPDGLERSLTRQQLADLLEFLSQQR